MPFPNIHSITSVSPSLCIALHLPPKAPPTPPTTAPVSSGFYI